MKASVQASPCPYASFCRRGTTTPIGTHRPGTTLPFSRTSPRNVASTTVQNRRTSKRRVAAPSTCTTALMHASGTRESADLKRAAKRQAHTSDHECQGTPCTPVDYTLACPISSYIRGGLWSRLSTSPRLSASEASPAVTTTTGT